MLQRCPSDGKSVQRWICKASKRHFSSATFQNPYRQHKCQVNSLLARLLGSGVSLRRLPKVRPVQFVDLITLEHTKWNYPHQSRPVFK